MFDRSFFTVAILAGAVSVGVPIFAGDEPAQKADAAPEYMQESAVFAGGCFWCVESDFEKLDGVHEAISGYTGGSRPNPTYKNHHDTSDGHTAHYEAVKVVYDPDRISYDELVTYFWRHVDPTDAGGQFCDRGDSYRTALFVDGEMQKATATASKDELASMDILPGPVVTPVLDLDVFWEAEEYHQDYYKKNPIRYRFYRSGCGRDQRVKDVWSNDRAES